MSLLGDDAQFKDSKLRGFFHVKAVSLRKGDHFRYTCVGWQEEPRKCVYAIVESIEADKTIKVTSYKKDFKWTIDPLHPDKDFKFYKPVPKQSPPSNDSGL